MVVKKICDVDTWKWYILITMSIYQYYNHIVDDTYGIYEDVCGDYKLCWWDR